MVFVEVILPVILIFLSGYIVQKIFKVDIKPISTMSIYILLPALVFETFYKTPLDSQLLYIVITSLLIFLALVIVVIVVTRLSKQDTEQESALILSSAFANSGNYGVPIVLFAFGKAGINYAIPIMVFHSIIMSIFGVYFAARGQAGIRVAIKTVLKQPTNYAIIPAILLQQFQVKIPANFYESIQLVGNCAVPIVMVILGMQLADVNLEKHRLEEYKCRKYHTTSCVANHCLCYLSFIPAGSVITESHYNFSCDANCCNNSNVRNPIQCKAPIRF